MASATRRAAAQNGNWYGPEPREADKLTDAQFFGHSSKPVDAAVVHKVTDATRGAPMETRETDAEVSSCWEPSLEAAGEAKSPGTVTQLF